MAIGITGGGGPVVNGDENFLVHQLGSLAGPKTDTGQSTREGSGEDCLLSEGSKC